MQDPERTSAGALFGTFPAWRALARRQVDDCGAEYIDEQVAIISWWSGDQLRGSSEVTPGELAAGEGLVPSWGAETHNRVRVRWWRGTLNVDRQT